MKLFKKRGLHPRTLHEQVIHNPVGSSNKSVFSKPIFTLFKKEGLARTLWHIEILLLFSLACAGFISAHLKKSGFFPVPDYFSAPPPHANLYANYRAIGEFIRLPDAVFLQPAEDPPQKSSEIIIPEPGTAPELIRRLLSLKKAAGLLEEKKYAEAETLLNSPEQSHEFLKPRRFELLLRAFYFQRKYSEYIDLYTMHPPKDDAGAPLLFINALEKTGKSDKGFSVFRELFKTRRIQAMESILGSPLVKKHLQNMLYEDWVIKFMLLAERNDYSGFLQEKKYSRSPQLAILTEAEFKYRSKQYAAAETLLDKVTAPELQKYREKILLKISVRRNQYENLASRIASIRDDTELYMQLLFDAASIALIKNNPGLALSCYSQYTGHIDNNPALKASSENYWKALWLSAWISLRQNNRNEAKAFFRKTIPSPFEAYSTASQYWLCKLEGSEPYLATSTPFSYYYTKTEHSRFGLRQDSLTPFISLIGGIQGVYFEKFKSELQLLLTSGFTPEAFAYARYAANHNFLNDSEKNVFRLIEAVLYWRRGDFFRAFLTYREHFRKYPSIRLPRFLAGLTTPLKFRNLIEKYSREHKLDPFFVMALIREESFYRPAIVSPAQANGLMQLILPTARLVAARQGMDKIELSDLFNPEINIRLGCAHLRELLDRHRNKFHLVLASYNAGILRVKNWTAEFGDVPDDMFIEMIPFTETRTYVKNIMRNYYFYKFYYGG